MSTTSKRQLCIDKLNNINTERTCPQCKELYEKGKSKRGLCCECYISHCEQHIESCEKEIARYTKQLEDLNKKAAISRSPCGNNDVFKGLHEKEIWLFYLIKDYSHLFIKNTECNMKDLSTQLLQESMDRTANLLKSVIQKKLVAGTVHAPKNQYRRFGARNIRLNVDLPDRKIDFPFLRRVKPIVPSKPAGELYEILCRVFPHVDAEQSPSTFLDQEKFLAKLTAQERKMFLHMRFNFVCFDDNYMPVLVAQYNGQHNVADRLGATKRAFQEKLCRMANIGLVQVNSYERLSELRSITEQGQ